MPRASPGDFLILIVKTGSILLTVPKLNCRPKGIHCFVFDCGEKILYHPSEILDASLVIPLKLNQILLKEGVYVIYFFIF